MISLEHRVPKPRETVRNATQAVPIRKVFPPIQPSMCSKATATLNGGKKSSLVSSRA